MPYIEIKVIKDVFDRQEKTEMIKKVIEAIVEVEGEPLRDKTFVVVVEIESGDWGIGGHVLTSEDIRSLRTAGV
jgi:4-oxalocrotonate tautomerase